MRVNLVNSNLPKTLVAEGCSYPMYGAKEIYTKSGPHLEPLHRGQKLKVGDCFLGGGNIIYTLCI